MESYIDTFKQYVPAEILAAFISINAFVPYRGPLDVYILVSAALALTILFIVSSWRARRFGSTTKMIAVAITLPFWCFTISATRFENYFDAETLRIIVSVALVIISLGLTLLAGKTSVDQTQAPSGGPSVRGAG